jgi:hypothetical protein
MRAQGEREKEKREGEKERERERDKNEQRESQTRERERNERRVSAFSSSFSLTLNWFPCTHHPFLFCFMFPHSCNYDNGLVFFSFFWRKR